MLGIDSTKYKLVTNKNETFIISKDYTRKILCKDLVYIDEGKAKAIIHLGKPEKIMRQNLIYELKLSKEFKAKTKLFYKYKLKSKFEFSAPLNLKLKQASIYTNIKTFNDFSSRNVEFIPPIKPFKDLTINKSNEFFCYNDMKDLDFTNLICERKFDGIRIQIIKDLNKVEAYTIFGNRIPNNKIDHILNEVRNLEVDICILDGELYSNRHEDVYTLITNKELTKPIHTLKIKLFDMLNYEGEYTTQLKLYERKALLDKIPNQVYMTKTKFAKVSSFQNLDKTIIPNILSKTTIEGMVFKDLNSTYTTEDKKKWYKLIFAHYLIPNNYNKKVLNKATKDQLYILHFNLHRFFRKLTEGKLVPNWDLKRITEEHAVITTMLDKHKFKVTQFDTLDESLDIKQDNVKIKAISSELLESYTDSQLIGTHFKLHVSFGTFIRHGIFTGDDISDLVNAHYRTIKEFDNRGFKHRFQDALDDATLKFKGTMKPSDSVLPFINKAIEKEESLNLESDPNKLSDKELKYNWLAAVREYRNIFVGNKTTNSLENIINLGIVAMRELIKRKIKLDINSMGNIHKLFYNKIIAIIKKKSKITNFSYLKTHTSGKQDGERLFLKDVLPHLNKGFKLSEPFVYLTGGLINNEQEGTTGDIDILIKKDKPLDEDEDRSLKFRILRALPDSYRKRVHFIYDNLHGPITNYIPLWNLELTMNKSNYVHEMGLVDNNNEPVWKFINASNEIASFTDAVNIITPEGNKVPVISNLRDDIIKQLKKMKATLILSDSITDYTMGKLSELGIKWEFPEKSISNMQLEEFKFTPGKFFKMPKPTHGRKTTEIYSPLSVINTIKNSEMWSEALETNGLYIEQKFDGIRCQAHKVNDKIIIWTEEGNEITDKLPTIAKELSKIKGDFECEFELELFKDGVHQSRAKAAGAIHKKEISEDESDLYATVYDCLYFNNVSFVDEPYSIRLEAMNKFKTKHIKSTNPILAKDYDEVRNAIINKSKEKGSEGAMIKFTNYMYDFDGSTNEMLKYKNEVSIFAIVISKHLVSGSTKTYFYQCAVGTPDNKTYIGKTFNTNIDVDVGDVIEVVTVEVSQYKDQDFTWFNWWSPRVIRIRDKEKATSIDKVKQIVQQTTGSISNKKLPKDAKEALGINKDKSLNNKKKEYIIENIEADKLKVTML